MLLRSDILAELIEPTLYALRQPRGELLGPLLLQARDAGLRARQVLQGPQSLHVPSFELGVATTFTQLLSTAKQRSVLNDALQAVKDISQGVETLHQLALIGRSAAEATQRDLADRIGVDRGNFSRRIRKLESLGLVESERRGQALVYALTPLGSDVLSELRPGWRAINPSTLNPIANEREAADLASGLANTLQQGMDVGFESVLIRILDSNRPVAARSVEYLPLKRGGTGQQVNRRPRIEQDFAFQLAR